VQTASDEERFPHLPGAVHALPDWLIRDAPFDVQQFAPVISREDNAAPLYLEALVEFGSEMAGCFSPEQFQERSQPARERMQRYNTFLKRWDNKIERLQVSRNEADNADLDQLLSEYAIGLQKLEFAQRRQHCVFETGMGISSLLPHVQSARQVFRVLELKVMRELDRGQIDRAMEFFANGLRLSRDLRPRGPVVCQVVSIAANRMCLNSMCEMILNAPGCTSKHCDQLAAVLLDHGRKSADSWVTGLQSEYCAQRLVIDQIQHRTGDFSPPRIKELSASLVRAIPGDTPGHLLLALFATNLDQEKPMPKQIESINNRLDLMSDRDYAREAEATSIWYRDLEPIGRLPHGQQQAALVEAKAKLNDTYIVSMWQSEVLPILDFCRRDELTLRGTLCLVALKRWQLTQTASPTDLASMLLQGGIDELPRDPYSDAPLRLGMNGGTPIVYSIGPDGIDDQGAFDSQDGRNETGDIVFRLR
jgi:hypothetical protein